MKIAHISDIHCGEVHFVPGLMERAINEINDQQPDIVVCSGDLTAMGFKHEYVQAKAYLDQLECDCVVVIPGNHDSRNVGYIHFEELFGSRNRVVLSAPPRQNASLLQPDRDHRPPCRRLAEVPVPRAGEDHPVLDADTCLREIHGADRGGGDLAAMRTLAIIDGEHYPSTVRDALVELPYEFV